MVLRLAALLGRQGRHVSPVSALLGYFAHGTSSCAMASLEGTPHHMRGPSVDQQIFNLCEQRKLHEGLSLFNTHMGNVGFSTYVCLMQSCSVISALPEAKYLHFHMIDGGLDQDLFLANMIMRMYDKCGSLADARTLFNNLPLRNIVSWNMIIGAYTSRGLSEFAFCLLSEMLKEGKVKPDKVTCITILTVCTNPLSFAHITLPYGLIVELKVEADATVGNVLINAYGRWGCLTDAFAVFDRMPTKSVASWNTLIGSCAVSGHETFSLSLFEKMHIHNIPRDKMTFIGTLNACEELSSLLQGMLVHFEIVENSLDSDILLQSKLMKTYGKCGSLANAFCIFESVRPRRDVFCWTIMIASYIQQGYNKRGLQLFQEMLQEGLKPNNVTYITLLGACTNPEALMDGKMIRRCIPDTDIQSDVILANALLTMYQKCGGVSEAEELFFNMPKRDVISYTAMIAVYAEQSRGFEALFLFEKMGHLGVRPDRFIFSSIIDACASTAALIEGRLFYHVIVESQLEWDSIIGNALVSLYGECGVVEDAYDVFLKLSEQDWVAWSAIIAAYGNHGHCKEAFELFHKMQQQGLKPTVITFVSVLSACSHAGLLLEGQEYFFLMTRDYADIPLAEHYVCMIDLVGRAGCVRDAKEFINRIPLQPNAMLWNTLLGACKMHGMVEGGDLSAKHVFEMDPQYGAAHVLLSNLYASVGQFDKANGMRIALVACTGD
ncbi:hypothetical protein GOP47_0017055 [Adiantum capillus-veneris]|uniref:Pentatricopeptide repeat-containing protein n=1 Tax=Adiantum capillus-veneris TaxID=13818 RepID=A0A9D4ZCQ6_ADICA|nr:hypothetical protein GOP47_0017055 [Adiantum capillus-veneris]